MYLCGSIWILAAYFKPSLTNNMHVSFLRHSVFHVIHVLCSSTFCLLRPAQRKILIYLTLVLSSTLKETSPGEWKDRQATRAPWISFSHHQTASVFWFFEVFTCKCIYYPVLSALNESKNRRWRLQEIDAFWADPQKMVSRKTWGYSANNGNIQDSQPQSTGNRHWHR